MYFRETILLSILGFYFQCVASAGYFNEQFLDAGSSVECCNYAFGSPMRDRPHIYCYRGRAKHPVHTFETVILDINIPPETYKLYEGQTGEEVIFEFESERSLWNYNPFSWKRKDVRLDPFNQTCIGIVTERNYKVELNIIRVDYWRVVIFVAGLCLFFLGPQLSNNVLFYYICGISIGVCASFLVFVYLISRLFPRKPLMYGFVLGGWAVGVYALQLLWENLRTISLLYKNYVIAYFFGTALLSFIVCYRLGPVSDPRSKNIIKWILQSAALAMIFFCSHYQEAVLGVDIVLLVTYNVPKSWLYAAKFFINKYRSKPKRRLLTDDEYHEQGVRETTKALDELRGYCSSPDCDQWKTIVRLKDPIRFAKFVQGSSHLDDSEVLEYDVETVKALPSADDYLTDDSE